MNNLWPEFSTSSMSFCASQLISNFKADYVMLFTCVITERANWSPPINVLSWLNLFQYLMISLFLTLVSFFCGVLFKQGIAYLSLLISGGWHIMEESLIEGPVEGEVGCSCCMLWMIIKNKSWVRKQRLNVPFIVQSVNNKQWWGELIYQFSCF